MSAEGFALISQATGDAFVFQFCPASVRNSERSNWKRNEATIGTKSLSYENSEPREISFSELYLDASDTDESIESDLKDLQSLRREVDRGAPPNLLYIRGSEQLRCVMTELDWEEVRFNRKGAPTRALVSLTLIEHVRVERTTVRTSDPEDEAENFNPAGNF